MDNVHGFEIIFRAAVAADRNTLLALCAAYRLSDAQPANSALVQAAVDAGLAGDPLLHLYLIERAGATTEVAARALGYLAITIGFSIEAGGRDAFVDELYLEADARGAGLGTRALAFAEQTCRELGVQRICLEVEHENRAARRLYERLGYRAHTRALLSKRLTDKASASLP